MGNRWTGGTVWLEREKGKRVRIWDGESLARLLSLVKLLFGRENWILWWWKVWLLWDGKVLGGLPLLHTGWLVGQGYFVAAANTPIVSHYHPSLPTTHSVTWLYTHYYCLLYLAVIKQAPRQHTHSYIKMIDVLYIYISCLSLRYVNLTPILSLPPRHRLTDWPTMHS